MKPSTFFDQQHGESVPLPLYFRLVRRWAVSRVEAVDQLIGASRALLDVGCGGGELERRVAGRVGEVVATDISPTAIADAQARSPGLARVRWSALDAGGPLPFADGAFDAVVAISTLQYLFDPESFLREAHRVLEPGGTLLLEVPNMAYLPQRLRLLAGRPIRTSFWPHGIDGGNLHYFTAETLAELVRAAGFTVELVTGSGVLAPLRRWWVGLLCGDVIVKARSSGGRPSAPRR